MSVMQIRALDPAHGTSIDWPNTSLVKEAAEIWLKQTDQQNPPSSATFDLLEFGPILRWCMVISVSSDQRADDFRYSFCGPGAVDFTGVDPTGVALGEFPNEALRTKWVGIFNTYMENRIRLSISKQTFAARAESLSKQNAPSCRWPQIKSTASLWS